MAEPVESGSEAAARGENPARIRVIACGMIAREVLAVNDQLGFDHIDLKCLPAEYHHHPQKIAPAMERAIAEARAEGFEHIYAGYGDCGTGGALDRVLEKYGVERIAGPHCFSFYFGNRAFAESDDDFMTTFFITDFLARQFDAFMVKPLGLDRHPELKEMYFSNYTRALYLAQTRDPELERKAREAAAYLGLQYEYRYTGYGDLAPALAGLADPAA
ncbi:MAG: DUF1638 domain-containing protein [Nitratireductor sp.]|nr:DUF1638 domain-containing protein [Nitratireductor sp.]